MADDSQFEAAYAGVLESLKRAQEDVSRLIAGAIAQLGNPYLVRGTLDGARVKTFRSVLTKCRKKELGPDQILALTDLVGVRVVCANLEDVSRLTELVRGVREIEVANVQKKKTSDGYRAVHIDILYRVDSGGGNVTVVPCEVQVRTMLQDSWAKQTHQDLYKGGRVPAAVRGLSKSLARIVDLGDELAQRIREEISQRKPRSGKLPEAVTEKGLALIYQRAFGESAPDYLLQIARHRCEEEGVDRLDALDRLIGNRALRRRLGDAYSRATSFHVEGYASHIIFEFAPLALRRGMDVAIDAIRKRAADDDAEIEGIYRREALSDMPDSFEEFMNLFEPSDKDDDPAEYVKRYASAFGATSSCACCSCLMVSEYDFAGEVQRYYGVKDHEDEILEAVWASGVECDGITCSSCSNALADE